LPDAGSGFALPALGPGEVLHLLITGTMRATPLDSPSVSASVKLGGADLASATTPVPLDAPAAPIETGCGCNGGSGGVSVALAMAAIMILQTRCARAASIAARRSCERRISPD
jgi:hypothetical protein